MNLPDILTHILVGISLALLVRWDGPRSEQMLIIMGSVLIDIERPVTWLLESTPFYWIGISSGFHSLLGALVLSYFSATCFNIESSSVRKSFMFIFLGCISHLALDMIMYPWGELGVPLLYPLKISFSFNLFWPDFWYYPLIGLAALAVAVGIRQLELFWHSK